MGLSVVLFSLFASSGHLIDVLSWSAFFCLLLGVPRKFSLGLASLLCACLGLGEKLYFF